jgi:GntR family transcriptional regulator
LSLAPRRDRRPLVLQLRDELLGLIRDGTFAPGERMPSEWELTRRLTASRGTVREALKLLEQDGVVDVAHGRGRFVSAAGSLRVTRPVTEFESVTEMLIGRGFRPTTHLLRVERRGARPAELEALAPADGDVVELTRLRRHAGEPLIASVNVIDAALVGDAALNDADFAGSLADWLARRGRMPTSSTAEIRASRLPEAIAAEVGDLDGTPWLLIHERCIDASGRPVLLSWDYHRGDVFGFDFVRRRGSGR